MDLQALWVTAQLASLTTLILLLVGLPLAWWLASTSSRVAPLVEAVVALPLVLPPTVLGFYVLLALAPAGPAGRLWNAVMGGTLPFSFAGILLASVLYNLPFAVRPFAAALEQVDRRLIHAAYTLGASPLQTLWTVVLPLAAPGLRAGALLTFAHAVGEFGVVLMVGGNVPGVTRTLSVSVYDSVQALDHGTAHVTAAFMMAFSLGVMLLAGRRTRGRAGL